MEEMFSQRNVCGKKKCDSETNSCRDIERDVAVLNLSVNGAAAFIHSQRPKTFREYKSFRYVREEKREMRERSFPVDRIVYLAERLELTSGLSTTAVAADGSSEQSDERPASRFSLDLSSITTEESDGHSEPETHTSVRHNNSRRDTSDRPKDLINIYMKSVDKERDLSRYFRACGVCGETFCVCAEEDSSSHESNRPTTATEGSRRPCYFDCCCPDFFEADYLPPGEDTECCCHCRTERVSRCGSDCSDKVLAYTSSLANAARSARVLARDLELVLNNFKTE